MMMAVCYKSFNDKSNNNKDNICLLLRRWGLVGYMLDYMLDQILDYMLDYMIIGFVTTALQLPSFLVWVLTNK